MIATELRPVNRNPTFLGLTIFSITLFRSHLMKIRIEITKGSDSGREFVLGPNEQLTIGRGGESAIQMSDLLISREHCEVKCDGKRLLLRDLGSTNKTFFVQGSSIEPIEPNKYYQIPHGNSFFAGPESRFTATYLPSVSAPATNAPPVNTTAPAPPVSSDGSNSRGNFSSSIETQPGSDWENSSIFNLLGDYPQHAKSLDTDLKPSVNSSEPGEPHPTLPASPKFQDPEAYELGSIAAPQNQGMAGREQVFEPTSSDPSKHGDARPEPLNQEDPSGHNGPSAFCVSAEPHQNVPPSVLRQAYASPPNPPASSDSAPNPADSYEDASIAPPHLQGIGRSHEQVKDVHDDSSGSTPKGNDSKEHRPTPAPARVPPPVEPKGSFDAFSSSVLNKSIAVPGHVYQARQPNAANPSQFASAFASAVPLEIPQQAVAPQENQLAPEPIDHNSGTAQHNGLHFHTGGDFSQLDGLIAELTQQMKPVYCVDFSRLEIEAPTEKPLGATSQDQVPAESGGGSHSSGGSAFEIEDEDEDQGQPAAEDQAAPAKLVGTPLFDFLPEGHQHNGPVLLAQSELNCGLSDVWGHDAMVVFFGPESAKVNDHLKQLLHTNIQTGKQFKGMFGFCWPSVLHTLFESQGQDQVKRVFGDAISHVLLEDPQQRHVWNLVALTDQMGSLQSLKNSR